MMIDNVKYKKNKITFIEFISTVRADFYIKRYILTKGMRYSAMTKIKILSKEKMTKVNFLNLLMIN